jgi:hypothetical protein
VLADVEIIPPDLTFDTSGFPTGRGSGIMEPNTYYPGASAGEIGQVDEIWVRIRHIEADVRPLLYSRE